MKLLPDESLPHRVRGHATVAERVRPPRPLVWMGSSKKDLLKLPSSVIDVFGYALDRAVYTVRFSEKIFVLHVFQNKSKSGIATPKADMDIIHERMRMA